MKKISLQEEINLYILTVIFKIVPFCVQCVQLLAVSGQYFMYSYRQYLDSTLCTVTGSIWTVPYVQLPAVSGQYLMYSYRQ